MIKSQKQAQGVQRRRYEAGRRGTAKAVRRFFAHRSADYSGIRKLPALW